MLANETKEVLNEVIIDIPKAVKELSEEFKRLVDKVNEVIASHNNSTNLLEELINKYNEVNFELKYKQELLARIMEHIILNKNILTKEEYRELADLYAKQLNEEILANAKTSDN